MRLVYGYALAVAAVMSAPNIIGANRNGRIPGIRRAGADRPGYSRCAPRVCRSAHHNVKAPFIVVLPDFLTQL
jgi:hypothetical protein